MSIFNLRREPVDLREDCGSWMLGELAVAVAYRWRPHCQRPPQPGDVLRVSLVEEAVVRGRRLIFLGFESRPATFAWDARGFRKVVSDDQPAEESFAILLPKGARVDA